MLDKEEFKRLIAPDVSEAVAVSWNNAVSKCVELAQSAGHFILAAEMLKLQTTTDEVYAEVLNDLAAKELARKQGVGKNE